MTVAELCKLPSTHLYKIIDTDFGSGLLMLQLEPFLQFHVLSGAHSLVQASGREDKVDIK